MGYFRFALAITVMAGHASAIPIVWAQGAVLVFYGLAGYLAAASMATSYRGRPGAFLINRWLRVWPCYAVVFLTALLWLLWRDVPPFGLTEGLTSIPWLIAQIVMLPAPIYVGQIVPSAWMLPWLFLGWALLSVWPRLGCYMCGLGLFWFVIAPNYHGFTLALWWMGFGAMAYRSGVILPRDGQWSDWVGELSFPLYLVHILVQSEVLFWVSPGWPLFFASLFPTLALSLILVMYVERPIARYRAQFRHQP